MLHYCQKIFLDYFQRIYKTIPHLCVFLETAGHTIREPNQKYRDLLKRCNAMRDGQNIYVLLVIELQLKTHYAMPVRNMLYDAINFSRQVEDIANAHRKDKTQRSTSDEFLSGFWKNDRLSPVLTLTVNLSGKPWDGPMSLHEMFPITDPRLLRLIPDHRLNLLSPDQISDDAFDKFCTGTGAVMEFLKHQDQVGMDWIKSQKRFENVDSETINFINSVTNSKIKFDLKEKEVNMSSVWNNTIAKERDDAFVKGKLATAENLFFDMNMPLDFICNATRLPLDQLEKHLSAKKNISVDENKN